MTREEAVNRFKGIRKSFSISIAQAEFYPSKVILNELCDIAIDALQAEPKHGKWIYGADPITGEKDCKAWMCSLCSGKYPWQPNYCPNCGAKMDTSSLPEEEQ